MYDRVFDSEGISGPEIARELWRAKVAETLGVDPHLAAEIAMNPRVDIATARELVDHGCRLELALQLATAEIGVAPLRIRRKR